LNRNGCGVAAAVCSLVAVAVMMTYVGAAAQLRVKWVFNATQGLESPVSSGHQGCQTVWDIDEDGIDEIIFGTPWGDSKRLWCIGADGAFKWSYPPMDLDGLPGYWISKVSLVDVNRDGRYELCFAGGGRLHALDGEGRIIWTWDNPNVGADIPGPPQAHDIDGDGFVDFFVADETGYLYRLNYEGHLVWSSHLCSNAVGQPTIADIDRDGGCELVVASWDGCLYCLDAGTGREEWRFHTSANIRSPPIVADVNKDSEYEALVWSEGSLSDAPLSEGGTLFCISFYGTEIWSLRLPGKDRTGLVQQVMPSIADFDGDGSMDMAIMASAYLGQISNVSSTDGNVGYIISVYGHDNSVYVIDIGGTVPRVKYALNFTEMSLKGMIPRATSHSFSSCQSQLVADIDGDNRQEILWLAPYPIVTDAATGAVEAYYVSADAVWDGPGQRNGGWWGDVDKDRRSEWICGAGAAYCSFLTGCRQQTGVYCLTLDGKFPAQSPWPEYYHSACPAEYQNLQDWLGLKAAYSNSLWFPMDELLLAGFLSLAALGSVRRSCRRNASHSPSLAVQPQLLRQL